nr:DUF4157 domain-containing protein [Terriglobus roseus]
MSEPGRPLPDAVRVELEIRFSTSLAAVRVHTGPLADEVARELGADALTLGQHIFFRAGKWQPETLAGRDLLAHEAMHTLQQQASAPPAQDLRASEPGEPLERQADEAAETGSIPTPTAEAVVARRVAGMANRETKTIDPARTVEELSRTLLMRVRADGKDSSGRIRNQLIRMEDDLRRDVLRWLEAHMESHEWRTFLDVLAEDVPSGLDGTENAQGAAAAPIGDLSPEARAVESANGKLDGEEAHDQTAPQARKSEQAGIEGEQEEAAASGEAAVDQPQIAAGAVTTETAESAGAGAVAAPAPEPATSAVIPSAPSAAGGGGAMEQPSVAAPTDADETATEASAGTDAPQAHVAEDRGGAPGAEGRTEAAEEAEADPSQAQNSKADTASVTGEPTPDAVPAGLAQETEATSGTDVDTANEGAVGASSDETESASETASAPAGIALPSLSQTGAQPEVEQPQAKPSSPEEAAVTQPTAMGSNTAQQIDPNIDTGVTAAASEATAGDAASESSVEGHVGDNGGTVPGEGIAAQPEVGGQGSAPGTIPPGLLGEFSGEPPQNDAAAPAGGGGGGGAAVPEPPPEPDAAQSIPSADPVGAMDAVGGMQVASAAHAMGAAQATVAAETGQQQAELAAAPPTIERPTGAPSGADGVAPDNVPAVPAAADPAGVAAVAAGAPMAVAAPQAAPEPGAPVTQGIARPQVTGTSEGKITESDARRVQQAVGEVPVTDEALNVDAGDAPPLALEGDADPAQVQNQQTALMDSAATNAQQGAQDAAEPMGEDHLYPAVTPGTIAPDEAVAGVAAASAGPEQDAGMGDIDIGVATVAEQEHGDEVRQHATSASGQLTTKRADKDNEQQKANTDSQKQVSDAIDANAKQQADERTTARKQVLDQRKDWTEGQKAAVTTARDDSGKELQGARGEITSEQTKAQDKANEHIAEGNRKIVTARTDGENKARAEREKAKRESEDDGGIFGWIASSISSFFNKLLDAVHAVFDAARKLVKVAIEAAQKLAHAVIDAARKAVVGLIQAAGKALLAIGDKLLAAFPALHDKFRKAIHGLVDAAVKAVNKLADALDKGIRALLNGLMKALNAILSAYEAIYSGIIKAVAGFVKGVLDKVRALIAALAQFAALVKDIAPAPGQWLSNLGASIMDGIRNHLWTALKTAFKQWFNDTIEGIIGMGRMVLDLLRKGGLSLKKIAGFVWSAIISAIPGIVIQFLIEKLIAMIIPAAGAVMLVIQGLIAAWGAIQRIIAAFQLFFTFLKAVKAGGAGPQFATALAAGAIALIQFLAGFIMSRLGGAASGVTSKLKAIAQKIVAFFKRVGKAIGKGLKVVGRVIVRGVKAVGRVVVRGAKAVGRVVTRGARAVARVATRAGKAVVRVLSKTKIGRAILRAGSKVVGKIRTGYGKAKDWLKKKQEQFKAWREKRKKNAAERKQKRLEHAVAAIKPPLESMLKRGVSGLWLKARLGFWLLRYRLTSLRVAGREIIAKINPEAPVTEVEKVGIGKELLPILRAAERRFEEDWYASRAADDAGMSSAKEADNYVRPNAELDDIFSARMARTERGTSSRHAPLFFRSTGVTIRSRRGPSASDSPALLSGLMVPLGRKSSYSAMRTEWIKTGMPTMAALAASPEHRTLRLFERARGEGMLPAMDLAQSLAEGGHANAGDVTYGALAPMAPVGAAQAAEVDALRKGLPLKVDPKDHKGSPDLPKYNRKKLAGVRDDSARRIANIFLRLRSVIESGQSLETTPGNASFPALGEAFSKWLEAHRNQDVIAKSGAAEVLSAELAVFLKTYRGG